MSADNARFLINWCLLLLILFAYAYDLDAHPVVKRVNLFQEVFGIQEHNMSDAISSGEIVISRSHGDLYIQPQHGRFAKQTICCGAFHAYSIGQLRKMAAEQLSVHSPANAGEGTFNVVMGRSTMYESPFIKRLDIGALQAAPENRDAVVQVASNFNALETVSADQNIEQQALMSYVYDLTQGPAASLSALPGLVLRRYLLYYDPTQPFAVWGQARNHQLNFLQSVPASVLTMSSAGYAQFSPRFFMRPSEPTEKDYEQLQVGVHTNAQVIGGQILSNDTQCLVSDPQQRINQVFTAAIDMANTNYHAQNDLFAIAWAKQIVRASYEGTILSAIALGKKRVFLTLVGGGVFGNKLIWLSDAIARLQDEIVSAGLEVIVLWYRYPDQASEDAIACKNQLATLVANTSGRFEVLQ